MRRCEGIHSITRGALRPFGLLVAALLLLFSASDLSAREKGGIAMPDTIEVHGQKLVLNGMGVREATVLNVDVYVAGLYVESPTQDAGELINSNQHKRLVLRFVRDVEKKDITGAWKDGFRKNAGKNLAALQERIDTLNGWMPDMKDGETLIFTYVPGKGVEVAVHRKVQGTIPGEDFARAFFSIWLGSDPPNKGLKTGLLGR